METKQIESGTRIYYGGDMANAEDFGTVVSANAAYVDILLDDGREIDRVPLCAFSDDYKGHRGTRFVTLEAYNDYRRNQSRKIGFTWTDFV